MRHKVAVFDYGSGNIRSAYRALERVGAHVFVTPDAKEAARADALLVPGVGAFGDCIERFRGLRGGRLVDSFVAGGRPVLGICLGHQIFFESGEELGVTATGLGHFPGHVEKLQTRILPHMGWNTVMAPEGSVAFAGVDLAERYYFVHSYGVRTWEWTPDEVRAEPRVTWAEHEGDRFIAAVEDGPLWSTQFHPEKSGDAGADLLRRWVQLS